MSFEFSIFIYLHLSFHIKLYVQSFLIVQPDRPIDVALHHRREKDILQVMEAASEAGVSFPSHMSGTNDHLILIQAKLLVSHKPGSQLGFDNGI